MKKMVALIIGLGILLSTTIAVWGFDSDNPLKPASIAPTVAVEVSR